MRLVFNRKIYRVCDFAVLPKVISGKISFASAVACAVPDVPSSMPRCYHRLDCDTYYIPISPAPQSNTTVTPPKKRFSTSTQTETVLPQGSIETVVRFLVQCIYMISRDALDMTVVSFSLAKEMPELHIPFR